MEENNQASSEVFVDMSNDHSPSVPKAPSYLNHKSFFNIPQSRFSEFIYPIFIESDDETTDEDCGLPAGDSEFFSPLSLESDDGTKDDFDSELDDHDLSVCFSSKKQRRARLYIMIDAAITIASISWLVSSLTVSSLEHEAIAGIPIWKFALLSLVISGGTIISPYIVQVALSTMRKSINMHHRTHYFLYSIRPALARYVQIFLIKLVWDICFDKSTPLSPEDAEIYMMDQFLPAFLLAIGNWHLKGVAFDMFTSSFYLSMFYDRMKGAAFHLYMLEALMGPPLNDHDQKVLEATSVRSRSTKLGRITALAFSTSRLPRHVADRMLLAHVEGLKKSKFEDTSQLKILKLARQAFRRVANGNEYIKRDDMLRFLTKEEVDITFPLMEEFFGAGKITKSSFLEWVVGAYRQRKSMVHAITDTKRIVENLQSFANIPILVIVLMIAVAMLGMITTKFLLAAFTQFLLLGFIFQNTAKTIFESIIFVFARHPFDVGDCCVIDGVQMIVEEVNIFTTVFLRFDHEKIYYPNSELSTKPITNCSRNSVMGEKIEFFIDVSTSDATVIELRKRVKAHLESKPRLWQAKHSLLMKGIEDSKMKMNLNVCHTINYQNFHEMEKRKSELLLALKNVFESLSIKNYVMP